MLHVVSDGVTVCQLGRCCLSSASDSNPYVTKFVLTSCGGGGLELEARLESEWWRRRSHSLGVSESDSRDVDVDGGERCSPSASSSRYLCKAEAIALTFLTFAWA